MVNSEAKELGNIFREAREKLGLSVEETNRRSRIHIDVINDIENGVFTRLNKLYVKSFLRKYAEFLKLDEEDILKKYEAIPAQPSDIEFTPEIVKKEKATKKFPAVGEKTVQAVLIGILSLVFVFLVIVLIGRVRAKITSAKQPAGTVVAAREVKTKAPVEKSKPAPRQRKEARTKRASSVKLTLEARGEAWVKVMEGKETLFVGVLRKGSKKSWKSDRPITVWTGRAEMLDFIVNNQRIGRIADGVVKNIKVSNAGITIDDNWVTRF
ncbi:MAG: helix-turn-helix domain-containing protein [Candidatus Omnitrophota bacterium]